MSEKIKLPEDVLKKIESIRNKYLNLINDIGAIELEMYNLEQLKKQLLTEYDNLKQEEKSIIDSVGKKYGFGKIDLNTGFLEKVE